MIVLHSVIIVSHDVLSRGIRMFAVRAGVRLGTRLCSRVDDGWRYAHGKQIPLTYPFQRSVVIHVWIVPSFSSYLF